MPLVAYNGRAKWNAPLRLAEPEWAPPELRDLQPRLACRLIDAKNHAGDDAADGNPARVALALDAASGQGLAPALARAEALFSAAEDQALWQSFAAWCHGILSRGWTASCRRWRTTRRRRCLRKHFESATR